MRKLLTILFLLTSFVTYSQSGVGYVNYTSYKTHNGTGTTNQYPQFAGNATQFDFLLNTANSNTTITHTGEVALNIMCDGSTQTPHWNSDFYAIKFEFWFIPKETGSYRFGVNSDDASDISVDGTIIATYYGGHGASGYQYGSTNMVAGTLYKIVARYQEYGGGDALYVRWSRPSAPNTYSYWNEEVTNNPSNPTKKAVANFYLNTNLNAKTFSVGSVGLSSGGSVDITTSLDSNKVNTGYKSTITPGGVEWSYCVPHASFMGGKTWLLIDMRQFGNVNPTTVNSVKILDAYDGPVTYLSHDANGWAQYTLNDPLTKVTDGTSIYNSSIRNMRGENQEYAFSCGISFSATQAYSQQSILMTTTNTLSTLYNSIVTVSDVYLAFKELANGGIFGNQSGNEFTYGIQYKNADVNDDGTFNEADCFALLQNLTGAKTLVDTFNLNKTMRIIPQLKYDSIGKSNWNTFTTPLGSSYSFGINTGKSTDTINLAVAWKGDVNLSHSTTPKANNLTTMSVRGMSISNEINSSIMTEVIGDSVYAYITLDPLGQNLMGAQFQLNYDNSVLKYNRVKFITKGSPTNWGVDNGGFIGLGSLITGGSSLLDNTTQYIISFTANKKLDNILGLISIGFTDAVNQSGTSLKVRVN